MVLRYFFSPDSNLRLKKSLDLSSLDGSCRSDGYHDNLFFLSTLLILRNNFRTNAYWNFLFLIFLRKINSSLLETILYITPIVLAKIWTCFLTSYFFLSFPCIFSKVKLQFCREINNFSCTECELCFFYFWYYYIFFQLAAEIDTRLVKSIIDFFA